MINIFIVLGILLVHWFSDFVLQTDWQAKNKSKNNQALFTHVSIYSLVLWLFILILTKDVFFSFYFWIITFICHFITDYFTSRLNTKLYSKGKIHEFFVSVGFDQFLHFTQLLLTYCYLKN